jgi:hypothetical protein
VNGVVRVPTLIHFPDMIHIFAAIFKSVTGVRNMSLGYFYALCLCRIFSQSIFVSFIM